MYKVGLFLNQNPFPAVIARSRNIASEASCLPLALARQTPCSTANV
ncbi:hypothetical protein D082_14080 [Synechocystis sp. PCC 6714]|nr:hypothetical protein D082_14080 [Synechocystis sp. PCC 6714]